VPAVFLQNYKPQAWIKTQSLGSGVVVTRPLSYGGKLSFEQSQQRLLIVWKTLELAAESSRDPLKLRGSFTALWQFLSSQPFQGKPDNTRLIAFKFLTKLHQIGVQIFRYSYRK